MTYDGPINTTYGEALAQLRDKIGGMASWTTAYDSTGGNASLTGGDTMAFSMANGNYLEWSLNGNGELTARTGPDYDTANGGFNDSHSRSFTLYPGQQDEGTNVNYGDQVQYWVEYVDAKGYVAYIGREMGDGSDYAMLWGHAEITRLWDYTTAQVREGKYAYLAVGTDYSFSETYSHVSHTAEGGGSGGTVNGKGEVNADGNNDNYPMNETTLVASSKYEHALIGDHDLWIRDQSGSRSAHLDTVTSGGGDLYQIFKENLPTPIGVRMD